MKKLTISISLECEIKKQGEWFLASCEQLDLFTQGRSEEDALHGLTDALELFLLSCFERGTLNQVLTDCGFRSVSKTTAQPKGKLISVDLPLAAPEHASCHHA